jgi:hypothetical protein
VKHGEAPVKPKKRPPPTIIDLSEVDRAEEFLLAAIREAETCSQKLGHSPDGALRVVFGARDESVSLAGLFEGFNGASELDVAVREYRLGPYVLTEREVLVAERNRKLGNVIRARRYEEPRCP